VRRTYGQRISGLTVDGRELHAPVFNENEVRAAAGMTMAVGAVAFAFAYFDQQYVPLQVAASLFFVDFLLRVTVGIRYSPTGVLAGALTRGVPPEWVSAKPKRFAWTIGLALSFSMVIITNSGVRGTLPRAICLLCITFMWLESVLGFCVGCRIHALLVRRGWATNDPAFEVCAGGVCEIPALPAERSPREDRQVLGDLPRAEPALMLVTEDVRVQGSQQGVDERGAVAQSRFAN
jgi:hypothetical protein